MTEADTDADARGADTLRARFGAARWDGEWKEREVPLAKLRTLVVASRGVTLSSDVIEAVVSRGIGLSFLSSRGQPFAQLSCPALGATVQTRRAQLSAEKHVEGCRLAIAFITAKLRNQRHTLLYFSKYLKGAHPESYDEIRRKAAMIARVQQQVAKIESESIDDVRETVMGLEGTGSRVYWEGVALIVSGKIDFPGRTGRGALDPLNAALNYGYGILNSQVHGAVVNAGLEPYAGFLHVDRPGKPSLVLDLVEEFRSPVVDRPLVAMVNQGVGLETDEHGLTAATKKQVAERILSRLQTTVPFEGKRYPLRIVIQMQARHVATAVRGERVYKGFSTRW